MQQFSIFHQIPEARLKLWHHPYAELFRPCRRVLDLGCGPGYFLDLLRERNVPGLGLDIDPEMVAQARERGHQAELGTQRDLGNYREEFDAVHVSHVIEHLWGDDALELIRNSLGALRPGGLLVIRTPNWSYHEVRNGGFWHDHTHKRPYPLALLEKLSADLGAETALGGHEPFGWRDTFFVARKPDPAGSAQRLPIPARLDWQLHADKKPFHHRVFQRLLRTFAGLDPER